MRVLIITGTVPFRRHDQPGVTAAHIVAHELIQALRDKSKTIALQVLFNEYRTTSSLTHAEQEELRGLTALGVNVLPPIWPEGYRRMLLDRGVLPKFIRLVKFLGGVPVLGPHYPSIRAKPILARAVESLHTDIVLTIWSPEAVAATDGLDVARVAYHGDVDFAPLEQRLRNPELFATLNRPKMGGISSILAGARQWFRLVEYKRAHFALMSRTDVIANVAASNARIYSEDGHRRSIYIRNVWSDYGSDCRRPASGSSAGRPVKIIGHVGYLTRTGSLFGLRFLFRDLLPQLDQTMGTLDYEIHVIGGGELPIVLRPYASHPRIHMRGYVDDLDSELLSSDMLLLLNNAGPYQAAFTRHMVAWSMGLCLIVHNNSQLAIPEVQHGVNVLSGGTPAEVAAMVRLAAVDCSTNERVRKGGRRTYEDMFAPRVVADLLWKEIESAVKGRASKTHGQGATERR